MADYLGQSGTLYSEKLTVDPSNILAGAVSVETFTATGLVKGRITRAELPDLETGAVLVSASCKADDVLTLVIWNPTGSAINPASQSCYVQQT